MSKVIVRSKSASNGSGSYLGGFSVESSDADSVSVPYKSLVKSDSGNGWLHAVEYYVDGKMFLKGISGGVGTIVLPKTTAGVPSGGLWNNNGVIEVKP